MKYISFNKFLDPPLIQPVNNKRQSRKKEFTSHTTSNN